MDWEKIIKAYLAKGLSVFPVNLRLVDGKWEKKPVVEWRTYMEHLATETEVDIWLSMLEFNALGLATGKLSGILVLDIDDKNETYGFNSSVRVKTISGGTHFWFKWKPGVRNTVRVADKPIDVRGDGGFVVIPPSGVGENKYEWLESKLDQMPEFPFIPQTEIKVSEEMVELPNVNGIGSRNQTAARVAGHMIANTNKKAWDTTAWTAFKSWNETMVSPPLDEVELRRTFDSICREETVNKPEKEEQINTYFGSDIESKYQKIRDEWGDGLPTGFPLLDDYFRFLPEQIYMLSAPTHHGKTTLALNMAAKIASFGHRVLFCSLEQGLFITPRIKSILGGDIPPAFGMMDSTGPVSSEQLIKIVNSYVDRPELLVVDHLHFLKKDTRNGITGAIDEMMAQIHSTAKKLFIPVLLIAHLRKLNENRIPQLDDLRDSSSLAQIPRVVMQMVLDKDSNDLTTNYGQLYLRKNSITGKLGKFSFLLEQSGNIQITPFIEKGKFV